MIDSIVKVVRGIVKLRGATDNSLIGNTGDRLKVILPEEATFSVYAAAIALGNNKSMLSLLNASGSTVKIKLREIKLINSQSVAVTGVISEFRLLKFTGHSGGSLLIPDAYDSTDSINASVSARTGATISGETASIYKKWVWSSDEFGVGSLDQEGLDHALQLMLPAYFPQTKTKPLTLNAGEGFTLKCVTNTTAGSFDVVYVFTQEAA